METLKKRASREDRLVVFFAGHGAAYQSHKKETAFLLLKDSCISGKLPYLDHVPERAIPMDQLRLWLSFIHAKHQLVLLDCRFSGFMSAATGIGKSETARTEDVWLKSCTQDDLLHVITAGKSGQGVYEDPELMHGQFTHFLLEGLRGEAAQEGIITSRALYEYVHPRVWMRGRQEPQFRADGGDGHFIFIRPNLNRSTGSQPNESTEERFAATETSPRSEPPVTHHETRRPEIFVRSDRRTSSIAGEIRLHGDVPYVLILPGTFLRGEPSRAQIETISEPFWISRSPIALRDYGKTVKGSGSERPAVGRTGRGLETTANESVAASRQRLSGNTSPAPERAADDIPGATMRAGCRQTAKARRRMLPMRSLSKTTFISWT